MLLNNPSYLGQPLKLINLIDYNLDNFDYRRCCFIKRMDKKQPLFV